MDSFFEVWVCNYPMLKKETVNFCSEAIVPWHRRVDFESIDDEAKGQRLAQRLAQSSVAPGSLGKQKSFLSLNLNHQLS